MLPTSACNESVLYVVVSSILLHNANTRKRICMAADCSANMENNSKPVGVLPAGYAQRGYATRKTVAQGLLDLALLLANGSQLKALIQTPEDKRDYLFIPVLVLIGLSVVIQIGVGILIIILGNMEAKTEREQRRANVMNNATVGLILCITVINVFISAFGIKFSGQEVVTPKPVTEMVKQVSKTVLEEMSWPSNIGVSDMIETTTEVL